MIPVSIILLLILNSLMFSLTNCESVNSTSQPQNVTLTLNGLVPPVFTPVFINQQLNLKVIPDYARYIKQNGMNGVLVFGTAGEYGKFTVQEKKTVLNAWLAAAKPLNLGVMLQVGGVPLPDAEELARYAEKVGVDAILTLPDSNNYVQNDPNKVVYFLKYIARAASKTPLLYYHFPSESHVYMDMMDFFTKASKQIPTFKGMKAPFDTALKVQTLLTGDQNIFVAGTPALAAAVLMGFDSFIVTQNNLFPKLVKRIVDTNKCQLVEIRTLYEKLEDYKHTVIAGLDYLPAMKVAMKLVTGIDVGPVRALQFDLTPTQKKKLKTRLKKKGIKLNDS